MNGGIKPADKPIISFEVNLTAWENRSIVLSNSIRGFKEAWGLL